MIKKLSKVRIFEPMENLISQLHKSQIKCGKNLFIIVIHKLWLRKLTQACNPNLPIDPKFLFLTLNEVFQHSLERLGLE